ncbi:hypothetical protein F5878DRAFT_663089 [Lentinula raphanica]|uniref:F-box domain-containing protein n=1 Tax=Lentinula raphanica TaxID=153919 RepID=A0AA38P508_9AGAR|nr:hypothetical protein F5878DRAFT_663089 [Lentinula raphanica]
MVRRSQRVQDKKAASGDVQMKDSPTDVSGSKSLAGLKRTWDDEDDNENLEEEYDDDDDELPKRKKKRTKKTPSTKSTAASNTEVLFSEPSKRQRMPEQFRKVRGKLGLLERLAKDMPLDIFCYLEPRDLLRLARTTKDLRGILMSRSSENIWRIARGNVEGLPPCPVDLNEPQYANLLFESYCHVCMRSGRCDNILWNFRMRSCQKCLHTFQMAGGHLDPHPLNQHRVEIIPQECVHVTHRKCHYYIRNTEIEQRYKAEYDAIETQEDRDAWISRKKDERLAIKKNNQLCADWVKKSLQNRANELAALRKDRKAAILSRLGEIGWRDEAETIIRGSPHDDDPFSNLKSVRQPKNLTDHGWRSIRDELVKFLSDAKDERLAQERKALLSHRVTLARDTYNAIRSKSDLREPFPTNGDILCNQIFRTLIWDSPEDVDLTVDLFESRLLEHLPEILAEWRAAIDQQLVAIMQKSRPTATISDLHLATTIFECTRCHRPPLYYSQLFYHQCCQDRSISPFDDLVNNLPVHCDGPWSPVSLSFSNTQSNRAKTLVEACSLDPSTATLQDMYDTNPLFECAPCFKRNLHDWDGGRLFMRWPIALDHHVLQGHEVLIHPLTTNHLGVEEERNVLACEPDSDSSSHLPLCCAHCHKPANRWSIIGHLKAEHNDLVDFTDSDKLPALGRHWYWHPRLPLYLMGQSFRYKDNLTPAMAAPGC